MQLENISKGFPIFTISAKTLSVIVYYSSI